MWLGPTKNKRITFVTITIANVQSQCASRTRGENLMQCCELMREIHQMQDMFGWWFYIFFWGETFDFNRDSCKHPDTKSRGEMREPQ